MTRLFGVIGHPIGQSLSPLLHTAAFRALRLDALYTAIDVPPAFLSPILEALVLCGVEGLNVTVPLKEAVVPLLDELDPDAAAIGAVNTIVIRNRRLLGYNTDAAGFRRALAEGLGGGIRGERVLLLGAGGAAKAVGWALLKMAPEAIEVASRTLARAKRMVRWLSRSTDARPAKEPGGAPPVLAAIPWRAEPLRQAARKADWIVNATTLGMRAADGSPIDSSWLRPDTRVYDLIYHRETPLVRLAKRRGCVAAGGLSMLLYQGAESLRLWLKRPAPIEAMQRALSGAVGSGGFERGRRDRSRQSDGEPPIRQ